MKFFNLIFFGWIFKQVSADQYNESISFSSNQSSITVPSYWHDSINFIQNSSIIEQGINVQLHLNEFQGLLFYAIDNNYRTIWVEFDKENIEINYYNFSINQSKKYSIELTDICISITSNKVNLIFLSRNNTIEIICNNNSKNLTFLNLTDYLPTSISDSFFETFPLPIPQFENSTTDPRVHLWIGNTPSIINKTLYRNIKLTSNPKNLFGCIQWFAINNIFLKLASTGDHYGDLISRFCHPVCNPNPCYNNGQCVELWRKQYFCDCKQTYFLGKHCDLEYSIRFDGSFSFGDFVNFNFTKLKFSFIYYKNKFSGKKAIIFLELSRNESFLIYISKTDYIHAKFINGTSVLDRKSTFTITDKKRYIVFVEVITGNIQVKISDSDGNVEIEIMLSISRNNLIINHIGVGNYHFPEEESVMFKGCFTNLALKSESKEYIWNEMKNFSNYPSCNEFIKTTTQTTFISTRRTTTFFEKENVTFFTIPSTKPKKNNNLIYIIIGSIIGVIILIIVILVILKYGFKKKRNERNGNKTAENNNDPESIQHLQPFPSEIGTPKKPFRSKHLKQREIALEATDTNDQSESAEQSPLNNLRDEIAV